MVPGFNGSFLNYKLLPPRIFWEWLRVLVILCYFGRPPRTYPPKFGLRLAKLHPRFCVPELCTSGPKLMRMTSTVVSTFSPQCLGKRMMCGGWMQVWNQCLPTWEVPKTSVLVHLGHYFQQNFNAEPIICFNSGLHANLLERMDVGAMLKD